MSFLSTCLGIELFSECIYYHDLCLYSHSLVTFSLFPALAVISVLGAFSAYTFGLYGRLVHSTQARSLGEIWERVKGQKSSWIISLSSMIFCFGACLSYSILLGDAFQALAASGGLSGVAASRPFWVLLVTLTTLLPLCSLQSLSSLAPMSLMGIFGMLATTCFLGWRCPTINAASPYGAEGTLLGTLAKHQLPSFGTFNKGFASPASMILGGMAAASFLGHFSAPDFYHALRKKDDSTDTDDDVAATTSKDSSSTQALQLRDFLKVTVGGFCAVNVINCFIMAFGFLTFGGNSGGVILNNYSTVDPWATVCRLLVAICVIGGYPFLLSACRGEAMALYKRKTQMPATRKVENNITRILLAVLAAGALVMKNAGFVVGLNGALIGSAIVYIFPSLLFLAQTGKSIQLTRRIKLERGFCRFLIAFGIAAGLSGASTSILNQYFPHILS